MEETDAQSAATTAVAGVAERKNVLVKHFFVLPQGLLFRGRCHRPFKRAIVYWG